MYGENLEQPEEETIIELPAEDVQHEGLEPLLVQEAPTSVITEATDQTQASLAQQEITRIAEFQPEVWGRLDAKDRIEVLQRLEDRLAEDVGRDPMKVVPDKLRDRVIGETVWEDRTIFIDERILEDRDEAVETLVHEARHGYQMNAIEHPWKDDPDRVKAWAYNSRHYHQPHVNEEAYRAQVLEQDADTFAKRVMSQLELREGPMLELPLDAPAIDEEELDG